MATVSASTTISQNSQNKNRGQGQRGKGNKNKGRTAKDGSVKNAPAKELQATEHGETAIGVIPTTEGDANGPQDVPEGDLCWICAEPVRYYSVSQCNHRTCHVCAVRLRALYKKMECTFCKDPQPLVIFTASPDAPFTSFTPEEIPFKDTRLSIFFETQELMDESMLLLRFNCPDTECSYIGSGWGDLKLHVRTHGKLLCDLCIRMKKVFAHEHVLYTHNQLPLHLPSMPHRSYKSQPKEQVEGGVHPLCEFCRECFFSEDELYSHMRERHEECFICKRNEVRDQYFRNYDDLEKHFDHAHHPCTQAVCQARKFVVFNTVLDLKAHMVEEHGTDMTARDKKDARRIQAEFEFEEVGAGGRRGRRDRGDREREREPPPPQPGPGPGPPRLGGRRREAFGATLTVDNASGPSNNADSSRRPSPSPPPPGDVDPVVQQRHDAFTARLRSLAPNSQNAVAAVKNAVKAYRASEMGARDLISTLWNVLDNDLDNTASLVNALVDILDDEDKKKDLLSSWNGFKIEQRRQFPDLVPSGTGSGYAGITSGRVLTVKHNAATRSSNQSSRQVWDRVAQAAGGSSTSVPGAAPPRPVERFPSLPQAAPSSGFRQPQRTTPWASSSANGVRAQTSAAGPRSENKNTVGTSRTPPPALSKSLFPDLPSSGAARQKPQISGNQSLKKILGEGPAPPSKWSAPGTPHGSSAPSAVATPDETPDAAGDPLATVGGGGGGKNKKGKGKQKQTLFTMGAFPT